MSSSQGGLTFPGGGEMARRMREYPWAGSPLGDPAGWPASLRTAVRICLTSRFPMIVWWDEPLYVFYNDAYRPLMGRKHPGLMRPGQQVWGEIWDIVGPMLESVRHTGQATWSEDLLLPMDRHGYWEEAYFTYSYSPLHGDDGTVRGVFTPVKETTEEVISRRRLAALHELGAQAGQARSVGEACTLVVRAIERAPQVLPYAAVYLRGPSGDAVLAASTAPDTPGGWPVEEVLRTGQPVTVTDVAARFGALPSGGWDQPPAAAMVLPLAGGAGPPAGAIVLAASAGRPLDEAYASFLGLVAQQTAALVNGAVAYQAQLSRADELAELDRAKTAFFSNVSHEFRTPLTLIMEPLEELRARLDPADTVAAAELDVIHRNGVRLGKLVNTLLDFSRIEAGRMQASFEPLDLGAFTAELASVFESAFARAGLGYQVACPPLSAPVYVDREMWEKVVFNLLSNALKFTFSGTVRVWLGEEDGHAVLRVTDTGAGIPAGEIPRLFDRFHRVENVPSRSDEGSGIGLALVRELAGLHGGTIEAASTGGSGSTFTVTIPFGPDHLPAAHVAAPGEPRAVTETASPFLLEAMRWLPDGAAAEATAETAPDTGGPAGSVLAGGERREAGGKRGPVRVLLADDNADMREYLQRLLEPSYQVTAVTDGQAALEQARTRPPDILIADVMMPRLDGLALVAALRSDRRTSGVPVLLLSARAGQEAAIEGLAAGADDYLVKPFAATELLARIRATVELARLRDHHARWRAALLDSLHEAFYLVDETGDVVEVNAGFTSLLGYGPEGLPYPPRRPWWPDEEADPEGHRLVSEVLGRLMADSTGSFTVPLRHRDGHRIWVTGSFHEVTDPESGRRMVVGTFRDVTAAHYAV
ncbi:MAG TPA: response regulator, partial [Streptosporangiaceae bacterium]|nr:response regulator [Streptosporangiaceae bacterium]